MQANSGPGPRAILGIFNATSTRDGEGWRRDGQPYVDISTVGKDLSGQTLFEIQFADGSWMLAVESDLSRDK